MKPVSIMWSQGVDTNEAEVAVAAVREFLRVVYEVGHRVGLALPPTAIRPFGTWYIPSMPAGSPYSGTTWYVETSFDSGRQQVDGSKFLDLVRQEPWQKSNPHWDLAIIDRDLVDVAVESPERRNPDFALGASVPELGAIISVHRLRGLVRAEQRELALRRLVFHFFGQVIGLPSRSRTTGVVTSAGKRYCENSCVMRQASSVEQVVRAAEQEGREGVALCDACRHDLVELFVMRGRSPN
jgi:predicted Zn-dependent protease